MAPTIRTRVLPFLLAAASAASAAPAGSGWDWGPAEAGFREALAQAQGYMDRMSDLRLAAGEPDPCGDALPVPRGRRQLSAFAAAARRQAMISAAHDDRREARLRWMLASEKTMLSNDSFMLRVIAELRATFRTADELAKKNGAPLLPDIEAVFASPMSEPEVRARLQSIHARAAMLAAAHSSERTRIARARYPDRGAGGVSKAEQRALADLDARMDAARIRVCAPGLVYFQRGLVGIIDPLVPKLRRHLEQRAQAAGGMVGR